MVDTPTVPTRAADGSAVVELEKPSGDGKTTGTSTADVAGLRNQIAKMKPRLEAAEAAVTVERQSRIKAESRVQTAEQQRVAAIKASAANALANLEAAVPQLEAALAAAIEAGDAKQVAKITGDLADARMDRREYTNQKLWAEQQEKRPIAAATLDPSEDQRLAPYAAFPQTMAWIKRHPQFLDDPKFKTRAEGYHKIAIADGYTAESPEYFQFIEEQMGLTKGGERRGARTEVVDPDPLSEAAGDTGGLDAAAARAASRAAAPSRRGSAADGADLSPTQVRLTSAEQEAAEISFPDEWKKSPQEAMRLYAVNKLALQTEGRLQKAN